MFILGAALLAWCAVVTWVARDARKVDAGSALLLLDHRSSWVESATTGLAGIASFLFVVVPSVWFVADAVIDATDANVTGAILLALAGLAPATTFGVVYRRARMQPMRPTAAFVRATLVASLLGVPLIVLLVIASAGM